MRAPPLARMAAVAAPSPDADPVITTHKPSFDICIPLLVSGLAAMYHSRGAPVYTRRNPSRGITGACPHRSPPRGPARLSWPADFRIMILNNGSIRHSRRTDRARHRGNAVTDTDNIVAETAARIFADLADPQTVARSKDAAWKAPLWQALADNGLPLSWVSDDCGGSGVSMAEGSAVLGAAGR